MTTNVNDDDKTARKEALRGLRERVKSKTSIGEGTLMELGAMMGASIAEAEADAADDDDWHLILLRGLEVCFRCRTAKPDCLFITYEKHQAVCVGCLSEREREGYTELVERVSEWEHEQSKRSPKYEAT